MLAAEYKVGVVAEEIRLPTDLHREVCQRLTQKRKVEPSVDFVFLVPLLCLPADPHQLLFVLLVEGELLEA